MIHAIKKSAFCGLIGLSLALTACDNPRKDNDNDDLTLRYDSFVTGVENDRGSWETDTAYWIGVDTRYQTMRQDINTRYQDMSDEEKKRVDEINMRYETAKTEYNKMRDARKQKMMDDQRKNQLRIEIFGADATPDFSEVNAKNILHYYERLVSTVEKNKDNYSAADWDAIKAWYEALDARKNAVEKEGLSSKDNLKIAKLKVQYDAIRLPERVDTKIEETVKDKQ